MANFLDITFTNKVGTKLRLSILNALGQNHQIFLPTTLPELGSTLIVEEINDTFPNFPAYFLGWGAAGSGGDGDGDGDGGDNGDPPDGEIPSGVVTEDYLFDSRGKIKQNLVPNTPTNKVYRSRLDGEPLRLDTIPNLPASRIIPSRAENDEGELVDVVFDLAVIPDIPPEKIIGGGAGEGIKSIVFEFNDDFPDDEIMFFEHNFGTMNPICNLIDNKNNQIYTDIQIVDENRVSINFTNVRFQEGFFRLRIIG